MNVPFFAVLHPHGKLRRLPDLDARRVGVEPLDLPLVRNRGVSSKGTENWNKLAAVVASVWPNLIWDADSRAGELVPLHRVLLFPPLRLLLFLFRY